MDLAKAAITFAEMTSAALASDTKFQAGDWRKLDRDLEFEMIYSVDGPFWFRAYDPGIERLVTQQLKDGGLFVVVGEGEPTESRVTLAKRYGLSLAMTDVVGGWLGDRYEGTTLLVFVKAASDGTIGPDLLNVDSAWDTSFQNYANATSTPWREKTQAFFRSRAGSRKA